MNLLGLLIIILVILFSPYLATAFLIFTKSKKPEPIKRNTEYRPRVTVFLPTYNEQDHIRNKLENLLNQTYLPSEILIIDCSSDNTPEIVREYQKKFPFINLVRQETRIGNAKTFNEALGMCANEILVKSDCDSLTTSENALEELVANFGDAKVGGATGVCVSFANLEGKFRDIMTRIQTMETNLDSTIIGHSTSLLAMRTNSTTAVNEKSMAEDTEELILIRKKGYRTVVDPNVVSIEELPISSKLRRKQKSRRAEGIIAAIFDNKEMLFNRQYGRFGRIVLPFEIFILIVSPFLLGALGIVFILILLELPPIYSLLLLAVVLLSSLVKRDLIKSILDTQINSLLATLSLIFSRRKPVWEKVR